MKYFGDIKIIFNKYFGSIKSSLKMKYLKPHGIYTLLPIVSVALFSILLIQPFQFLPDLFHIEGNRNISMYLSTVLSSISSLLGLLIVVIIIAYEYYKSNLKSLYLKYFIGNKYLIALLNFYIFSFVFSGLTLLTLSGSSPVGGNEITIAYLSLLSFISLLPLTFYLSYKLVRSLELNEIIDEYLRRLSFDKIFLISKNNMIIESTIESDDHSTLVDMVENDSLSVLYNFIINQIQSNNIIKSQLVLYEIFNKYILYFESKNEEDIAENTELQQYRFSSFLINLLNDLSITFPKFNKLMLEKIMSHIVEFYKKYNLRKLNLSYIEPFRLSFFDKIFEVYSENYTFRFIVLKHYSAIVNNIISTNLPPQESLMRLDNYYKAHANRNIKEEYSQSDYENHKKWDLVCSEYLNIYLREMDLCIAKQEENHFLKCHETYCQLVFSISWKMNADSSYYKYKWIHSNYYRVIQYYKRAIEKGVVSQINGPDVLSRFELTELLASNNLISKNILGEYYSFIIWLNRTNRLKYDIFCGVFALGNWGNFNTWCSLSDLGNLLISNYSTNDLYAECTDDLFTTIEIVIKDCSNGIKSDCITKYNIFELLNELVAASTALEAKNKTISYGVLNRINSIKRNTEAIFRKSK